METKDRLRQAIAEFFEVAPVAVGPGFSLTGPRVSSSVGRAALASRIRRQAGLASDAIYSATTYGELERTLFPGEANTARPPVGEPTRPSNDGPAEAGSGRVAPPPGALSGRLSCGVDLEMIDNLPAATDYWEDAFYRASFTPSEIAYCLMQERPALHFAARWCAKEALKKCDAEFLPEEMRNLEVVLDESGRPSLQHLGGGDSRRLPHAVSISHTPTAAIAVVMRAGPAQSVVLPASAAMTPGPPLEPAPSRGRHRGGSALVPTLLALAALCVAILALLKSHQLWG